MRWENMGRYYYLKGGNWGCGTWAVLLLIFVTSPIWIHLLGFPLNFLVFLGEIGEDLFGKGNAALFLLILMLLFLVLVAVVGSKIEGYIRKKKAEEDKEM